MIGQLILISIGVITLFITIKSLIEQSNKKHSLH